MFAFLRRFAIAVSLVLFAGAVAAQPDEGRPYTEPELESLLAPIALYPDPLLAQVLMAATYPLEVVEAARWSRAHPELIGDDAVRAVEGASWDPSVKSLVAFPQLLQTMDERIGWTQQLGEAFLGQMDAAMDTVQRLRQAAEANGNLAPNDEIVVQREGDDIVLEPAAPDIAYVPYYDPRVVYGDDWFEGAAPVYWPPWPGYSFAPGYAFGWAAGIPIGYSFFFGAFDWHGHRVRHREHRPFYYHGRYPQGDWQHDPRHHRGVPYHNPTLTAQYGDRLGYGRAPDGQRGYRGSGMARPANPGYFGPQLPGAQRPGLATPDRRVGGNSPAKPIYRGAPGSQAQPVPQGTPQYARPVPQGTPQYARPVPQGTPQYARPVPQGSPQYARPVPQGTPQYVRPAPQRSPQYVRPVPQGTVQYVRPAPQGAPQYARPVPQGSPASAMPQAPRGAPSVPHPAPPAPSGDAKPR